MGSELFFYANSPDAGYEPHVTNADGSSATLLVDLKPGLQTSSYSYSGPVAYEGRIFFGADDGVYGEELFVTDGTAAGTTRLSDIYAGGTDASPESLVISGGNVFFSAWAPDTFREIYISDGTDSGTQLLRDIFPGAVSSYPDDLVDLKGTLLFVALTEATGFEPFVSDGTTAGTQLLADLVPGSDPSNTRFVADAILGDTMFFTIDTGDLGDELWKTDGTTAGTELVKIFETDLSDTLTDPVVDDLITVNGTLFFTVSPSYYLQSDINNLWRSDGTAEGTHQIGPVLGDGSIGVSQSLYAVELTPLSNSVIFSGDAATGEGQELMISDGTDAGTALVIDIYPGSNGSYPEHFTPINDGSRLVFAANDGVHGDELWITDGTAPGTYLLADIDPSGGSSPFGFTAANGLVYFSANDGTHGRELWVTDGTAEGTHLVEDLVPGTGSSNPGQLTAFATNAAPTLTGLSSANVDENSATGTLVGLVQASDPDGDALSLSLTDSAGGLFALDGNSLVVNGVLDFEGASSHNITLEVSDPGGLSDSASFTITVNDINEPPSLLSLTGLDVDENSATGTVIGTVQASDPDDDTLSLSLTDNAGGLFALDGNNLVANGALDFESAASHDITLEVSDPGGLSDSATFTITVNDLSDEEPTGGVTLVGTSGDDELTGTPYADLLTGEDGNDTLDGGAGDDGLFGGAGDDLILGGTGDDNIGGSDGKDSVDGGAGDDLMGGGTGDDIMEGGSGDDFMGGGQDNDTVDGGEDNDVVNGGPGDDSMIGGDGNDTMGGSFGADTIEGNGGNDDMGGGAGQDQISAGAGNDSVGGGEANDVITGGGGDDFLAGGGRDDRIDGGTGNDTINGGDGDDTMTGGSGADVFVWNFFKDGDEDTITDFEDGIDSFRMVGVENAPGSGLAGKVAALNITNTAGGALIDYQGHTVLIEGVAAADLTVEDFTFL
ncbi:ELWxxDGT repeat protein [Aestuariicoccus sp. MJ-SS9]|uniref:ELWxxDGT repeat protein n=1 Tax=Aestuariicoccus sp. MJ-SS9 TaxID=3079855 RepID=UPI002910677F|nr:ELWxxDGT repeat protein [Aestuariicoccus sp. MJ-SS9]MDU8913441.1 hypothetical protein [Aestuariicoccus sp. MJ-SS9]